MPRLFGQPEEPYLSKACAANCAVLPNINPDKLEKAIERVKQKGKLNPKAIIAVDLFWLLADFERIKAIAEKNHLLILEDGAQGLGGAINGKRACSFGDIATTSFFPAMVCDILLFQEKISR